MLQLFQSSTRHGHALPRGDARLASEALEQMPVATMLCDPIDHRVTFANRRARDGGAHRRRFGHRRRRTLRHLG